MRKLDAYNDNPIDNILLIFAEMFCPFFKSLNFTPNGLTTLSLIFGLCSVYALYIGKIYTFALFYFISYFFDCMDGHYARKYDMVTKFGDAYDHVKDALVVILLLIVFFFRNRRQPVSKFIPVISIIGISILLTGVHMGCQESIYSTEESPTLSHCKYLCSQDAEEKIKYTRYFGCGTGALVLILSIVYFEKVLAVK
jgi:phosphatidylglycerophosphate synthase